MDEIEEILHLLVDPIRRELLFALNESDSGTLTVDRIIEQLDETDDHTVDEETLRIQLHHKHLPRLDDTEGIDFDRRSGTIRYDEPPPSAIDLIDAVAKISDRYE